MEFSDLGVDTEAPTQVVEPDTRKQNSFGAADFEADEEGQVDHDAPTQATKNGILEGSATYPKVPPQYLDEVATCGVLVDPDAPTQTFDCDLDGPTQLLLETAKEAETFVDPDAQTQVCDVPPDGPTRLETTTEADTFADPDAPTQLCDVDVDAPTQAVEPAISDEEADAQSTEGADTEALTQDDDGDNEVEDRNSVVDSDDENEARSRSDPNASESRLVSHGSGSRSSRSRSRSASSRSRSGSPTRERASRSMSGSASSRAGSVSRPRSRTSRSRSGSHASSKSGLRSRSASRSSRSTTSRSGSRGSRRASRSRSRSRSGSPVSRQGDSSMDEEEVGKVKKRVVREAFGEDSDSEAEEKGTKQKRTRINSDGEEENEEATDKEAAEKEVAARVQAQVSSSDDEGVNAPGSRGDTGVCDFDVMLEKKKAEQRRRRRKKDIDLINDNDDAIAKMIADMKLAAREDRDLNAKRFPATKKISMLPTVMSQLNKADLQMAFVEANVLSVLTDWLAPMPDKSLPSVQIRKSLLKLLSELLIDDHSRLKESGIGKAVMYLYKHPRELRDNKDLAGKIINSWARPIFNLSTDFKSVSKEERMARDELLADGGRQRRADKPQEPDETGLRPGDPGWCQRARVPKLSNTSYINRPEWTSDVDISHTSKREVGRLEKHMRAAKERKRNSGAKRAVNISIEGRRMAL